MNAPINTNVRLFDLVRYMRSELHEAGLITDDEYFWICAEAPMAKGAGSPSPRRLEDYDHIRAKMKRMEDALRQIADQRNNRFESTVSVVCGIADAVLASENTNVARESGDPTT